MDGETEKNGRVCYEPILVEKMDTSHIIKAINVTKTTLHHRICALDILVVEASKRGVKVPRLEEYTKLVEWRKEFLEKKNYRGKVCLKKRQNCYVAIKEYYLNKIKKHFSS